MKKWSSRESMRRFRCRKRCEAAGIPIPEWAAIRDQKKNKLPDTPRRVYFRNYYHNNKTRCYEYTRRYRVRARCEMDGLPVPEWALLRKRGRHRELTDDERKARHRKYNKIWRARLRSDPVRWAEWSRKDNERRKQRRERKRNRKRTK